VLGVPPDASHEEVKRAYTSLSLKHRPAGDLADQPAAIEEAAYRRHELDEAWRVLRSPSSRAAYDESLLGEDEVVAEPKWEATGAWAGRDYSRRSSAVPVWFAEPEVADIEPLDEKEAAPRKHKLGLGPLAVGAALLIVFLIALSRINTDSADVTIQTRERFPAGACVDVTKGDDGQSSATEVPCSGPHTGQVVSKVDVGQTCTPHTEYTELEPLGVVLCLKR
jgi:curved DNA-binding protein CbpA